MRRQLIHWLGLTGVLALFSYAAAVVFSPLAYPGYNWMAQAVSDLSAETAPSRQLWDQLAAPYNICSVVSATCAALYVSQERVGTRSFRIGICLFMVMNWVSALGYGMFPLADGGTKIASFREIMHIAVTAAVVLLSIASLVCLIVAGCREKAVRGIGLWASAALVLMLIGSVGTGIVPAEYFGIAERSGVFAAVGFNAVLGVYLFHGFKKAGGIEHG
ncbi:MAG: DUF998 domain-containing protein [Clostridia bacterium]|nr:DUF998 domain-containing protein [Clostridia bacterium]